MSPPYSESLPPVTVHLDTPSVARVYDYFLGGTTNWEVDRSFGDQVLDRFPLVRRIALAQRVFLERVVRYMVGQGVRQFLDVGSGVPGPGSAHDVADACEARVVFVDNDPIAVAHTELLLDRVGDRRRHAVVHADLRAPEALWQQAFDTELLTPGQPIGLLLVGVLHLQQPDAAGNEMVPDCVAKLCELLPMGSYAAISHVSDEGVPDDVRATLKGVKRVYADTGGCGVVWRSHAEIEAMLDGYHMVAPGWTTATEWHPETPGSHAPVVSSECIWAGVGTKP